MLNADGTFSYQHDGSETLSDSFTYQVTEASGGVSEIATVTITVNPINDPPVADDDNYATDEDTVLDIAAPGVLQGDFDAEGQTLQVESYDAVSQFGAIVTVNADGGFTYNPTQASAPASSQAE